jgi:hypothetical protein
LTVILVAATAVGGSLAGRAVWGSLAEEEPKANPPPLDVLNSEAASEKFQGELLGVFIAPRGVEVPDKFTTYEELCGSKATEQVAWEKAGEFGLDVELPEPFKLDEGSLNTGVVACGDTVSGARWEYRVLQPSGYPGQLFIARSEFKYFEIEASPGRVHQTEFGGVPAVFIDTLSDNGIGPSAGVIFPGAEVTTQIVSNGVPREHLLKVAEIVAAAVANES